MIKIDPSKSNLIKKSKLFLGVLLAANTSALAIYLAGCLAACNINYWESMALFLGYRVLAFMADKKMPLNDENVEFMSSERILWNLATIAVLGVMMCLKQIIF